MCDRCGAAWHLKCAELPELPKRYWYCQQCTREIETKGERDITYDSELLDYLQHGLHPQDTKRLAAVQRAAQFLRYSAAGGLEICRQGSWLKVPSVTERKEIVEERHVLMKHAGAHAIVESLKN